MNRTQSAAAAALRLQRSHEYQPPIPAGWTPFNRGAWAALRQRVLSLTEYIIIETIADHTEGLPEKQEWAQIDIETFERAAVVSRDGVETAMAHPLEQAFIERRRSSVDARRWEYRTLPHNFAAAPRRQLRQCRKREEQPDRPEINVLKCTGTPQCPHFRQDMQTPVRISQPESMQTPVCISDENTPTAVCTSGLPESADPAAYPYSLKKEEQEQKKKKSSSSPLSPQEAELERELATRGLYLHPSQLRQAIKDIGQMPIALALGEIDRRARQSKPIAEPLVNAVFRTAGEQYRQRQTEHEEHARKQAETREEFARMDEEFVRKMQAIINSPHTSEEEKALARGLLEPKRE